MFRISKVLENESTVILKIEGKVPDGHVKGWAKEIQQLVGLDEKQIVLDICHLSYLGKKAADSLIEHLTERVYLLNGPTDLKNKVHSAGLAGQLLD